MISESIKNLKAAPRTKTLGGSPFLQVFRGRRRGRLLRHYFVISVLLIAGGLITSGLLETYFRYHESQEHLAILQREAAAVAAVKIERFHSRCRNRNEGSVQGAGYRARRTFSRITSLN